MTKQYWDMARPTNTDERRDQILDGLQQVMAARGFERASVAAIAKAVGLAPGLVHYHFASKEEVLVALVARLVERFRRRYAERLDAARDDWARLDAFIDAVAALGPDADPAAAACWAQIGAEAQRLPSVAAPYREALAGARAELAESVRAVCATSGRPDHDAELVATGLLATLEGAFHLSQAAPGVVPPGEAAGLVRRMARGVLA